MYNLDAETGLILDILANRELKTVKSYLTSNFQHLEYLNQDLWITYKNAGIAANADVKIVADMFHVVRTALGPFPEQGCHTLKNMEIKQS